MIGVNKAIILLIYIYDLHSSSFRNAIIKAMCVFMTVIAVPAVIQKFLKTQQYKQNR